MKFGAERRIKVSEAHAESTPRFAGSHSPFRLSALLLQKYLVGMNEYQAVIVKLSSRTQEDEDALTDLLNERSRGGWTPKLISQGQQRITLVFSRVTEAAIESGGDNGGSEQA